MSSPPDRRIPPIAKPARGAPGEAQDDREDDDWPTPEAREAARRHDAGADDNALESIGKAVAAPVLGAAGEDEGKPEKR